MVVKKLEHYPNWWFVKWTIASWKVSSCSQQHTDHTAISLCDWMFAWGYGSLVCKRFPKLGIYQHLELITVFFPHEIRYLSWSPDSWNWMLFLSFSPKVPLFGQVLRHGFWQLSTPASGDAVDKGAGDIRVVKTLLTLKQRYGSRAPRPTFFHSHGGTKIDGCSGGKSAQWMITGNSMT